MTAAAEPDRSSKPFIEKNGWVQLGDAQTPSQQHRQFNRYYLLHVPSLRSLCDLPTGPDTEKLPELMQLLKGENGM